MIPQELQWIPTMRDAYRDRLNRYAKQADRLYPGYARQFTRASELLRGSDPSWPDWCWMPMYNASSIMAEICAYPGAAQVVHISQVTALAAWQASGRRVYFLHRDTLGQLPVDEVRYDEVPRLPDWCAYIATTDEQPWSGFFVHLEWDEREQRAELRLLLDNPDTRSSGQLMPQPVHLDNAAIRGAVGNTWAHSLTNAHKRGLADKAPTFDDAFIDSISNQADHLKHLVAAALYPLNPNAVVHPAATILGESDDPYTPGAGGPDDDVTLHLVTHAAQEA